MKKTFLFFLLISAYSVVNITSATEVRPPVKATEVYVPAGQNGELISLMDISQMSVKEYQKFSGRKMSFLQKVNFKVGQRELKKTINNDGSFNKKKVEKFFSKADATSGFHLGGFALGFLLWLLGVLIAYLINDDKKAARVKWAWIGAAIATALGIIFAVI